MTTAATTIGAMAIATATTMPAAARPARTTVHLVVMVLVMTWGVVPTVARRKFAIIAALAPVARRTWLSVVPVARGPISAARPVVVLVDRRVAKVGLAPMDLALRLVRRVVEAMVSKTALPASNGSWKK